MRENYPLNSSQYDIWVDQQIQPDSPVYNIGGYISIKGSINYNLFNKCINALINNNDSLRLTFSSNEKGEPVQFIKTKSNYKVPLIDFSKEDNPLKKAITWIENDFKIPFSFSDSELYKFSLLKVSNDFYLSFNKFHHLVVDGWGISLMGSQLITNYNSQCKKSQNGNISYSYIDYLNHCREYLLSDRYNRDEKYWRNKFFNQPESIYSTHVFLYPGTNDSKSNRASINLKFGDYQKLTSIAQALNTQIFSVFLGILYILLHKITGLNEIVIGIPLLNRFGKKFKNTVGLFVDTSPLVLDFLASESIAVVIAKVKAELSACYRHQRFPVGRIEKLAGTNSLNRLYDVILSYEKHSYDYRILDFDTEYVTVSNYHQKNALTIHIEEYKHGEDIKINFDYRPDCLKSISIEKFIQFYQYIIQAIIQTPEITIRDIELVSAEEKDTILNSFNNTNRLFEPKNTIIDLFEKKVTEKPDAVALVYNDCKLSYKELNEKANIIGNYLLNNYDIKPDDRIGLMLNRSENLIISLLGILKTGAAYVPIDPEYPEYRISYIINDSKLNIIISDFEEGLYLDIASILKSDAGITNTKRNNTTTSYLYIIYTSGTTGNPKGSIISNRNYLNYISWADNYYLKNDVQGNFGLFTSISFDLTTTSIYLPLLSGGTLIVYDQNIEIGSVLKDMFTDNIIDCIKLTPSHISILSSLNIDKSTIKLAIVGGEELLKKHINILKKINSDLRIINEYGPTETTVGCTAMQIDEDGKILIGKPISNTHIYIMKNEKLCPIGIPGEICVGGEGVGIGYFNKPELTEKKFINDPFVDGGRLYRTGDLGSWQKDGNIAFWGRIDDQVKIRGYRIELNEIANALRSVPGINDSAVVALSKNSGEKYLAAYYVSEDKQEHTNIRAYLADSLPNYMVPAFFIHLRKIPLTSNGKIDKKSLPDPASIFIAADFVAIEGDREKILSGIWKDVLGIDRSLGAFENFFDLGGDSIKAIQIVSRLKQIGLHGEVATLFNYPTIREFSLHLNENIEKIDQALISGELPLNPIQNWFFNNAFLNPGYYNQSILIDLNTDFKGSSLKKAFEKLIEHHDSLRLNYIIEEKKLYFNNDHLDNRFDLPVIDVTGLDEDNRVKKIKKNCLELKSDFDLRNDLLIRAAVVKDDNKIKNLFITVHHVLIDGISWRILLEDLFNAYSSLISGNEVELPAKTLSLIDWNKRLVTAFDECKQEKQLEYWRRIESVRFNIPTDNNTNNFSVENLSKAHRELSAAETAYLMFESYKSYNTDVATLLLTSLVFTLQEWLGENHFIVELENHGRHLENADVSRTIGWFTAMYPVELTAVNKPNASLIDEQIKLTKEQLKKIPDNGLAYGILKHVNKKITGVKNFSEIRFNYLGDFVKTDEKLFAYNPLDTGADVGAENTLTSKLEINCMVVRGKFLFNLGYSKAMFNNPTIQAFSDLYFKHLRKILAYTKSQSDIHFTPSDFDTINIDQTSLDTLFNTDTAVKLDKKNIEDIMALTPVQAGMLFHYLENREGEHYFEQLTLDVSGNIELESFKKAWNFVVESNELLRTCYRWHNTPQPLQIVLKKHETQITFNDCSGKIKTSKNLIEEIKVSDRKNKFNLEHVPFRVALYKIEDDRFIIMISQHHIIYDGWSTGIILKEFLYSYNKLLNSEPLTRFAKTKFKDFVSYVNNLDKVDQEQYWQKYLKDFDTKTTFPLKRKEKSNEGKVHRITLDFSGELSSKIREVVKTQKITLAAFLYTIWGIVLHKYTADSDILFGTTVSGRNAKISGIDNIVGLFINTIPLRIRIGENDSTSTLLQNINKSVQERGRYENTSLSHINEYTKTQARENLFDSILVIENYPIEGLLSEDNSFSYNDYEMFYLTNYDITITVTTFDEIYPTFTFSDENVNPDVMKDLAEHFKKICAEIVISVDSKVHDLQMLNSKEIKYLVDDLNETKADYQYSKVIHKLFERRAEKSPDAVALVMRDENNNTTRLTYSKLNEKANQLAHYLIKNGIGPEKVVGILMNPSFDTVMNILAVFKAGGAYLPIAPGTPPERIQYMLENGNAEVLLTDSSLIKDLNFTVLQNFTANSVDIILTKQRTHIKEFNSLPVPDRSLINLCNYKNKIGMASVTNCISIQATRGCPYKCIYCHKVWSKFHVFRSAESIYNEIEFYYKKGVVNFAIIDDCFNLDKKNSSEVFRKILKNNLKLQLFFPNGLRGDILTPDYIDLMTEAGTRNINLSLETASSRLQKLLKKNLNIDKFRDVMEYIAIQHPEVILELATMHGFPSETEKEAMLTLDFIKDIKWIHFPYIHILKIYPNTEMEDLGLSMGVSRDAIMQSKDLAYHELPETLPFPKSFTRKYQSSFLNDYFLNKERLEHVLPIQMRVLSEEALAQKYNAYLPVLIKSIDDILGFAELVDFQKPMDSVRKDKNAISIFDNPMKVEKTGEKKKFIFLDLSQYFSSHSMLYNVSEQPLGLISLLTYLKKEFPDSIDGRIYKAGIDFDSYAELKQILDGYNPDLIGIRTLTFYKDFFHETVATIRQWGFNIPVITGGPYSTSDYDSLLKDKNIDLAVIGEGEYSTKELIKKMLRNSFKIPAPEVLDTIGGIAYSRDDSLIDNSRKVLVLDRIRDTLNKEKKSNPEISVCPDNMAYVMYTSGSTGKPKGVIVEHKQVNNCISWMQDEFRLTGKDRIVWRTSLTFDPSVWEIFWPLYEGASVHILDAYQSRDAEYLLRLMAEDSKISMMYCPASLVTAMTYLLINKNEKLKLKLPYLIIGAEPVSRDVINNFFSFFSGKIINTYGPTECAINNTYCELDRNEKSSAVPIGKPVANNQIYILSNNLQLMPFGTSGEICIAGKSVVRGYINDPELTAQKFIKNPFGKGRMFRTGDIGKWTPANMIEIMGRKDEQVKIRGYRIELGEIENAVLTHSSINDCAVIARDNKSALEIKSCKICGITTMYPGVMVSKDGLCSICENLSAYKSILNSYFKNTADLKAYIALVNKNNASKYDCLIIYNGGRGAAFALYQLVEMGFNVLALTYDNGYLSKREMKNIRKITNSIGVDQEVITYNKTNEVLSESLKTAKTVCSGCFHISSSLAQEYAYNNNIKVVVGATLSPGQIIENKLFMFINQGMSDISEIEKNIQEMQKSLLELDKNMFNHIDIDIVKNGEVKNKVVTLDFYRYCNISNTDMISYLNSRDGYWESRKNYAIYSTNCPLKQIGDFGHQEDKGFHFYGSATSWEKRLGHITLENLEEDLKIRIRENAYNNFIKKIGYQKAFDLKKDEKYLCAYYVSNNEIQINELREYLSQLVPGYMIPAHFMALDKIPLTVNGKVDKKALPAPKRSRSSLRANYVEPKTDYEKIIADIWKETLQLDSVGINDNFFELGGNSLDIIQVSSKLKEKFNKEISIVTIFTYPTINTLAAVMEKEAAKETVKVKGVDRKKELSRGKDRRKERMKRLTRTRN